MLASLDAGLRKQVLDRCPTQHFDSGALIVREGELAESFYLIESGRVALRVTTEDGDSATLAVLGAGSGFGEMALVGPRPRTATAVALEPVTTVTMSRVVFNSLRSQHTGLNNVLVDILSARLDRVNRELVEALYLPVDIRLARRLLALVSVYRQDSDPVVLPLTQDDIAGLVGARRPTVNQILNRLADDGVVRLSRGKVTVLDPAGLRARAS